MRIDRLNETSLLVTLSGQIGPEARAKVRAFSRALREVTGRDLELVPAFTSVGVLDVSEAEVDAALRAMRGDPEGAVRTVEIPVCYDGPLAPDLADVARHTGLSEEAVIGRHTAGNYLVDALGFAPGFPFLSGLDPALATPRRATPRTRIEAGAVGIGGAQTGVYPSPSPGGWNLIGRTPRRLFRPEIQDAPTLLEAGDAVRFVRISEDDFTRLAAAETTPAEPVSERHDRGILVRQPGLLTTVQAAPRRGLRHLGVAGGGPMDSLSAGIAHLLAGPDAFELECTLAGPELEFEAETLVALCGADFRTTLDGAAFPLWRPVVIPRGSILRVGHARRGCRAYLSIAGLGGIDFSLGSHGTDLRSGVGGFHGRALRAGDRLPLSPRSGVPARRSAWSVGHDLRPIHAAVTTLRLLPGEHRERFPADLSGLDFRVSSRSDRMGVRLCGAELPRTSQDELISAAVLPGTVQVPPDGHPLILGADAQTIGGYPKLGHVIRADLPLVGQLRPDDRVAFEFVSLAEAMAAGAARDRELALLQTGLHLRGN